MQALNDIVTMDYTKGNLKWEGKRGQKMKKK